MADTTHPTRTLLLDTGLELADTASLAAMPIDDVVRAARVAKGTFYVHFASRTDYLLALHQHFHDRLRTAIENATTGLAAGGDHLRAATLAYLEGCLNARGVKAMLAAARGEPAVTARVAATNRQFAIDAQPDFAALGANRPFQRAMLYVAMVAEIALLELDAGDRDPRLRNELWELAGIHHQ
jgi:TetR/AcrR family transcriptional regulator, transcriptional repressor for nem operon